MPSTHFKALKEASLSMANNKFTSICLSHKQGMSEATLCGSRQGSSAVDLRKFSEGGIARWRMFVGGERNEVTKMRLDWWKCDFFGVAHKNVASLFVMVENRRWRTFLVKERSMTFSITCSRIIISLDSNLYTFVQLLNRGLSWLLHDCSCMRGRLPVCLWDKLQKVTVRGAY